VTPEIVFVPGLGAPGYLRRWVDRVSRWAPVTVLDLPGWHRGRARRSPPTVAGIADGVIDWLGARAGEPVVLVGHSTAAQSAALVARRAPNRLCGLVLGGAVFDPAMRGWAELVGRFVRTAWHESPGELGAVLPKYLASGLWPLVRLVADGLRWGDRVYGPVDVPVAVLTGRSDHLAPPTWARELGRRLGAEVCILPGGHNYCYTHPADADAAVRTAVGRWTSQSN
jgi:pimeloyl-ACP methyl ester carboxylesterase